MVQAVVTPNNLGPEFDQGVLVANKITVKVDGTTVTRNGVTGVLSAAGVLTSLTYNALTSVLTYTDEAGNAANIDLSALTTDLYITGAAFNPATMVLTLTDASGVTPDVTVDLSTLLGVSADAGNLLEDGADGKPMLKPSVVHAQASESITDAFAVPIFNAMPLVAPTP